MYDKKKFMLTVSLLALCFASVLGTLAILMTQTGTVKNVFTATQITNTVDESFDGSIKNDVKIKNTGNIDGYIRAKVIFTLKDSKGNVSATEPQEDVHYTIQWTKNGWEEKNGFFYYTQKVAPNDSTGILFTQCTPVAGAIPAGYSLSVEILGQAIQAQGSSVVDGVEKPAVTQAWGISVNADGTLKVQ